MSWGRLPRPSCIFDVERGERTAGSTQMSLQSEAVHFHSVNLLNLWHRNDKYETGIKERDENTRTDSGNPNLKFY